MIKYTKPKLNNRNSVYEVHELNEEGQIVDTFTASSKKSAGTLWQALITVQSEESKEKLTQVDVGITPAQVRDHQMNVILNYKLLGYNRKQTFNLVNNGGHDLCDDDLRWGIKWNTFCRYYELCNAKLHTKEENERERAQIVLEAKLRWSNLLRMSLEMEDLSNAREAAKQLDKLTIPEETTVNLNVKRDNISKMTDQELLEYYNSIKDK